MTQTAQLIKTKRKLLKMKQTDLAQTVGCTNQFICNIEHGMALIPANLIGPISKALKINKTILVNKTMLDIRQKFYSNI